MDAAALEEARRLLLAPPPGAGGPVNDRLTAAELRRRYLRLALRLHPDKNKGDASAGGRFAALGAAYEQLLASAAAGGGAAAEAAATADLLALLLRALRGEDVEAALRAAGGHRPPPGFGVDAGVRFDGRLPLEPAVVRGELGIEAALADALRDEGLDEEGNPLEGWARPLNDDDLGS